VIVAGDAESDSVSTAAIVHAALTQPAGIVGQHGGWLSLCDGASGAGM
jgi:hypothetical protein